MSSSLARDIPEELLDIINELIMYEEKEKNYKDGMERAYIYDYINEYYEQDNNEESYKITIQL